jgi:hypothetical protein
MAAGHSNSKRERQNAMKIVSFPQKSTPQAIANEFLDLWEKAHNVSDGGQPDYDGLKDKFAIFTGKAVSMGDARAVAHELHKGRKARGWPNPKPAPPGKFSIEPTIEAAIMGLWLAGLR